MFCDVIPSNPFPPPKPPDKIDDWIVLVIVVFFLAIVGCVELYRRKELRKVTR